MEVCQYNAASEKVVKERQQKVEILRLQKKSQDQLHSQTQMINDLSISNAALREELVKTDTSSFSASKQEKVIKLQAELDELEMKIEYEKMKKANIDAKYINTREVIAKTRKAMSNTSTVYDLTVATDKQVNVLNSRLEHTLRSFNEVLSRNNALRAQIDSLKEERRVFQQIYKKIEVELNERKLAMAEKIESANMDYEERDKLKQELDARRQIVEEDRKLCQESFMQLDKVLEQLKQTVHEQKRQQMASITVKTTTSKNVQPNMDIVVSPSASRPRCKSNTTTVRNSGNTYSERCGTETSRENTYDEEMDLQTVVDDLKSLTGQEDLRLLHDNFIKAEQTNFSMYNYLNTLNIQEEELEHEIAKLREEYEGEKEDFKRRTELKALEDEIAAVELQQEKLESDSASHQHVLAQVRKIAGEVYVKVRCDKEEAASIYGTDDVNDSNLVGFLGMIEQRVNELLFAYNSAADSKNIKDRSVYEEDEEPSQQFHSFAIEGDTDTKRPFIGIGPTTQPAAVTAPKIVAHVSLPSTNVGDNHNDKLLSEDITSGKEEILSHEEMRQRVEQRIQRRIERMESKGKASSQKKTKK